MCGARPWRGLVRFSGEGEALKNCRLLICLFAGDTPKRLLPKFGRGLLAFGGVGDRIGGGGGGGGRSWAGGGPFQTSLCFERGAVMFRTVRAKLRCASNGAP